MKFFYRPEIDGLRAISILGVVLFHFDFQFFSGGYLGVDVFIVISGFLITSFIFNRLKSDQGHLEICHASGQQMETQKLQYLRRLSKILTFGRIVQVRVSLGTIEFVCVVATGPLSQ